LTNIFMDLSVYENVWLAVQSRHPKRMALLRSARRLDGLDEKTRRVLEEIGLTEHAETVAKALSYGDQRHLEIGLALATEPQLLLLDEPTSGMSPVETRKTIELIQSVSKGLTLLLIEHDMDVVMTVSDRILVMHYGQVLADGTPDEIEKNQAVQEAYLGGFE
ncbi:ATP-binding cassette domain-containing protein, partial [Candidatus Acetothermia bacterium]|nr:ATP-binding cassette domain-containing protein [Candidatus Acetothermia bacterium]